MHLRENKNAKNRNRNATYYVRPIEKQNIDYMLSFDEIENLGLEVYYNGDRAMTEFKIKCYKKNGSKWSYVGIYTPDFLIIKRKDGKIHKIIVVETKGEIYAKDPTFKEKKTFMETEFSKQNNTAFGYERFDYKNINDRIAKHNDAVDAKLLEFLLYQTGVLIRMVITTNNGGQA